jgi:hypothetical protein
MSSPWRSPTPPPLRYTFLSERECSGRLTDYYTPEPFPKGTSSAHRNYMSATRAHRKNIGNGGLITKEEAKIYGLEEMYNAQEERLATQSSHAADRHEPDELDDKNVISQRRDSLENQSEEELVGSPPPKRQRQRITTGGRAPRRLTVAQEAIYKAEQAAADAQVDEDDPEDPRSNRFKHKQRRQEIRLQDHLMGFSATPKFGSTANASSSRGVTASLGANTDFFVGVMTSSPPRLDPAFESMVEDENKTVRELLDEADVDETTPKQLSRNSIDKESQAPNTSSQASTDSSAQIITSPQPERQSSAAVSTSSRTSKICLTRGDNDSYFATPGRGKRKRGESNEAEVDWQLLPTSPITLGTPMKAKPAFPVYEDSKPLSTG